MKELYRNPPGPDYPGGDHREGVQRGLTDSGIPVYIIATRDAYYDRRKWGFDAGLWEHSYCISEDDLSELIVSYHAASQTEKITTAIASVDWWRTVPGCMRDR